MRRYSWLCPLFLIILSISVSAEETSTILNAFQKNFTRGSLSTKIQVLQDAANFELEDMGPLYFQAVEFIVDNSEQLKTDTMARDLSILAVRLTGISEYKKAAPLLWELFTIDEDTYVRIEIMNSLGKIATGNQAIIVNLNSWISSQNSIFRTGGRVDKQVIAEAVTTLGKLGDKSSFPVIFSTGSLGYSEIISKKSKEALTNLNGNYKDMIINVIEKSPIEEKNIALKDVFKNKELTEEEKGEIGEVALEIGLYTSTADLTAKESLRQLRYEAIRRLTELKWSKAAANVIENFDVTILEYDKGLTRKTYLLEAVAGLGAVGTHEAAMRLTLYLELLNSYTENGQPVDEQIILSVIRNLGLLGDKVAFDYLLYTGYLNYSNTVKKAARESLDNLKRM